MSNPLLDGLDWAWKPSAAEIAASPVDRFARRHGLSGLDELARRAGDDPQWFWGAAADDVGVEWMRPYDAVLDLPDGPEWARFFVGGELNAADNAVDRWVRRGRGDEPAVIWTTGDVVERLTYDELGECVARAAGALLDAGLGRGDALGVYLPMWPEAVVAILAAARIGAMAIPMFSGYGAGAVRDRLADGGAVALVTTDGWTRRGRPVDMLATARAATAQLEADCRLIVVRRGAAELQAGELDWDRLLERAAPAEPVACRSDEAMLLLYTSGSTGRPKGCVHTHGGLPIKVAQEARHGFGVDVGSRVLWLTDMGWIMGPWSVMAALMNGGAVVLFDDVPDWPHPGRLWEVAGATDTTVLGLAPTVIRSLVPHGPEWVDAGDLRSLRALGSTGEPWNLEPWWWYFEHVGHGRVPVVNLSGGTEIGGSILSGCVAAPVKPMAFAGPCLGMAADVVDETGRSVREQVGELVLRSPWPGRTRGFWRDPERYLETYWRRWPGVWHHGDFAYVDGDGAWYLLGRSDDTIKVAGKRLGPTEVETLLVADDAVVEAAALGIPHEVKGEELVCLVVLVEGEDPAAVVARLADRVEQALGRPARPSRVLVVDALPKTRNGKVMRRVARSAYLGLDRGDLSALDDPAALDVIVAAARDQRAIEEPSGRTR